MRKDITDHGDRDDQRSHYGAPQDGVTDHDDTQPERCQVQGKNSRDQDNGG